MADYIQSLSKLSVTRSGGSPAFVSTGSTTSAFTGNLNVSGMVTGGSVTSSFASLSQILSATISAKSLSTNFGSFASVFAGTVTAQAANMSTLTIGTILNFSAGGSLGTNLFLTGTLTANSSSSYYGSFASISLGTVTAASLSVQTANMSTLTVGTILNFSAGGSLGTNLFLTGTLTTPSASITTLLVPGSLSVKGLLSNNVTGYLQARCYDDSAAYLLTAGTVGQPLPPAGLSQVISASQTSSLNLSGATFGTLASKYSVRISGSIQAVQTGTYTFQMTYQDGLTIWVGASKLVDSWKYLAGTASSTSILTMYAGMWLPIAVEHATATSNEKLLVQWALNGSSTFSTLAHGTGFNLAYELTDTPPAFLSTTYISGQVFVNDIVNMAAGASYQGAQFFSGYLSQLTNDAGYVSTLGSTITGTALMINGPYASITGTLNAGTLIAGSIGAVVGSIATLNAGNARLSGSLLAAAGIAGVNAGNANSVISLMAQTGSNLVLSFASGNGVTGSVLSIVSPVGIAGNWCSDAVVGDSVMRATTGSLRLLAGSGAGPSQISLAQNSCVGINNANPIYSLDISGQCRVSGTLSPLLNVLSGALGSATNTWISLGGAQTTNNSGFVSFLSIGGSGSSNNFLGLGVYGQNGFNSPLAVTGNAQVGINNTSPSYTLDVSGSARISGTLNTSVLNGTSLNVIGVGTIPGLATVVGGSGTSASQLVLQGYNHPTPASIAFNTYGANFGSNIVTRIQARDDGNGGGILALQTSLMDRLTILNNGYIGVNTSSPAYTLDVAGSARVTGTLICSKVVGWTNITCQGYLTAYGSGWTPPQYCVDELGYVRLRGLGTFQNNTGSSTLFTLPTGARPTNGNGVIVSASVYDAQASGARAYELRINTSGVANWGGPYTVAVGYCSFDNICFATS